MTLVPPNHCSVLIVGGGPCGLMLANELGRRGIRAVLIDQKPTTAFNPQANATQARTMEHFRRLGFADEIRALGLPPDVPHRDTIISLSFVVVSFSIFVQGLTMTPLLRRMGEMPLPNNNQNQQGIICKQ